MAPVNTQSAPRKNREGLTYREWYAAAGQPQYGFPRQAWIAGEDPSEYRLGEPARAEATRKALDALYEATGDHQHDGGPLAPGAACPGGDCLVSYTRQILAAMREVLSK